MKHYKIALLHYSLVPYGMNIELTTRSRFLLHTRDRSNTFKLGMGLHNKKGE